MTAEVTQVGQFSAAQDDSKQPTPTARDYTQDAQRAVDVLFSGKPYTAHRGKTDATAKAIGTLLADRGGVDAYQYISANPIKEGHTRCPRSEDRSDADRLDNVLEYCNWVIELDHLNLGTMGFDAWKTEMEKALEPLTPIVSVKVFSGDKSIHCFVSSAEPVDRKTWALTTCALLKLIPNACKPTLSQANHMVRMPNGVREKGKRQDVLFVGKAMLFEDIKSHLVAKGVWDERGVDRLELKIQTSGGMGTNIYSLIIAPTAAGKDCGGVVARLADRCSMCMGSGGSREGVVDALSDMPSGVLLLSEFEEYMDKKSWQHRLVTTLTDQFNRGWLEWKMSGRSGSARRIDMCFPSMIASVQPDVFANTMSSSDVANGFVGRLLITMVDRKADPMCGWRSGVVGGIDESKALAALEAYQKLLGVVVCPQGYSRHLLDELKRNDFREHTSRLANEYLPRFAVMLANSTTLTTDHWERAEVIARWFAQFSRKAVELVGGGCSANPQERFEHLQGLLMGYVRKLSMKGQPISRADISRMSDRKFSAKERETALDNLVAVGELAFDGNHYSLPK